MLACIYISLISYLIVIVIIVSKLGSNTDQCYQVEFSVGARITPKSIKISAEFNRIIKGNT